MKRLFFLRKERIKKNTGKFSVWVSTSLLIKLNPLQLVNQLLDIINIAINFSTEQQNP